MRRSVCPHVQEVVQAIVGTAVRALASLAVVDAVTAASLRVVVSLAHCIKIQSVQLEVSYRYPNTTELGRSCIAQQWILTECLQKTSSARCMYAFIRLLGQLFTN